MDGNGNLRAVSAVGPTVAATTTSAPSVALSGPPTISSPQPPLHQRLVSRNLIQPTNASNAPHITSQGVSSRFIMQVPAQDGSAAYSSANRSASNSITTATLSRPQPGVLTTVQQRANTQLHKQLMRRFGPHRQSSPPPTNTVPQLATPRTQTAQQANVEQNNIVYQQILAQQQAFQQQRVGQAVSTFPFSRAGNGVAFHHLNGTQAATSQQLQNNHLPHTQNGHTMRGQGQITPPLQPATIGGAAQTAPSVASKGLQLPSTSQAMRIPTDTNILPGGNAAKNSTIPTTPAQSPSQTLTAPRGPGGIAKPSKLVSNNIRVPRRCRVVEPVRSIAARAQQLMYRRSNLFFTEAVFQVPSALDEAYEVMKKGTFDVDREESGPESDLYYISWGNTQFFAAVMAALGFRFVSCNLKRRVGVKDLVPLDSWLRLQRYETMSPSQHQPASSSPQSARAGATPSPATTSEGAVRTEAADVVMREMGVESGTPMQQPAELSNPVTSQSLHTPHSKQAGSGMKTAVTANNTDAEQGRSDAPVNEHSIKTSPKMLQTTARGPDGIAKNLTQAELLLSQARDMARGSPSLVGITRSQSSAQQQKDPEVIDLT